MTTPPPPGNDHWPAREPDVIGPQTAETTVVADAPPPPPPPPGEPGSRIGWGLVLGLLAVGLAAAAVAVGWYFTRHDDNEASPTTTAQTTTVAAAKVAVPDVRGKPVAEARSQLEGAGFETQQTEMISDKKAGTVVDQSPEPEAKIATGATVTLGVSKGEATTGNT